MPAVVRVRAMRNFRLRHKVSLQEIADASGKTCQWISKLEMGHVPLTRNNKLYLLQAFQTVIQERRKAQAELEDEFTAMTSSFFAEEPEWMGL